MQYRCTIYNIHISHAKSLKITRVVTIDQAAFSARIIERRRRTLTSVTSAFNWRTLLTVRTHTHTHTSVYQNAYTPTRHTSIAADRGGHELIATVVVPIQPETCAARATSSIYYIVYRDAIIL